METTLVIGDPHTRPGVSNRRFTWLGRLIAERRPGTIVCLGDFSDFPSLSSYDVGKKSFEGRRYKDDLASCHDALRRIQEPIIALNKRLKRAGKPAYRPRLVMLGGNHDQGRLSKVIDSDAKMDGTIGIADCRYEDFGWDYIPFMQPVEIQGINYQHYFTTGVMGKPIGGESPALALLTKTFSSSIQGHNHLFGYATRIRPNGQRIRCFSAGCYLDPDQREDYAGNANMMWDRGLLLLHDVKAGDMSGFEWMEINKVRKLYG